MTDHDDDFREIVRQAVKQGIEGARRNRRRYDIWFFAGAIWTAYPFITRFDDPDDRFARRLRLALLKAVVLGSTQAVHACLEAMRMRAASHDIEMPRMSGFYEYADHVISAAAAADKDGDFDAKYFAGTLWTARPFVERLVEPAGYTRKLESDLRHAVMSGNKWKSRIAIGKMRSFAKAEGVDMPDRYDAPIPGALKN